MGSLYEGSYCLGSMFGAPDFWKLPGKAAVKRLRKDERPPYAILMPFGDAHEMRVAVGLTYCSPKTIISIRIIIHEPVLWPLEDNPHGAP